jgi:hypothetical protein
MDLWKIILETYPEVKDILTPFAPIVLQDDADGEGAYIAKWDYSKPIPDGLKLGK